MFNIEETERQLYKSNCSQAWDIETKQVNWVKGLIQL